MLTTHAKLLVQLTAVIAILLVSSLPARNVLAQEFPSRNLVIVVPYPPGGGTDIFARAIGVELSKAFGRAVTVENRSGASGLIGAEAVANASPDGHTLLYAASTIALSRLTAPKSHFDPQRDLATITQTVTIPQFLVAHAGVSVTKVDELIAASRKAPGEMTYASGGIGSAGHFAMERLKLDSGLDARHVPYRGAAPALNALLAGEVHLGFLVPTLVRPYAAPDRLKVLAVSSRERSPMFPDVPTLRELGFPEYEAMQWHGFFVPGKTPASVVARLHQAVSKALDSPSIQALASKEGAQVLSSSPEAFESEFKAEMASWADVAREAAMRFE
jgi:tripartite-type tricarboxylate transporter receptor subunit TctC